MYTWYSFGQTLTCTHHGHAWSGILGPLTISLNCSFIRVKWQRTSIMTLKQGWAAANFSWALECWFWHTIYFLGRCPLSRWWESHFTVESDAGVPVVFHSWQAWAPVVPGPLNQLPLIWGCQFGTSNRPQQSGDTSEKTTRDLPNVCKSTILLRSSLGTLDFQCSSCSQSWP